MDKFKTGKANKAISAESAKKAKDLLQTRKRRVIRSGAVKDFDLSNLIDVPVIDKIGLIKSGISKDQFEEIKAEADLDYDTLSVVLSVSRAKLLNKKGAEKFDQLTSERIMLLADLVSYGKEVFDDKDKFNLWMKKTNKSLGEKTPLELMDTVYGIAEIRKELGRIEYGIF